jgi:hypothetical protein
MIGASKDLAVPTGGDSGTAAGQQTPVSGCW